MLHPQSERPRLREALMTFMQYVDHTWQDWTEADRECPPEHWAQAFRALEKTPPAREP